MSFPGEEPGRHLDDMVSPPIKPATDKQIAEMTGWGPLADDNTHALIARIHQEQARADKNLAIARDEEARKLNAEQEAVLLRELVETLMLKLTDLWHEGDEDTQIPLHEFCGISAERYKAWVEREI